MAMRKFPYGYIMKCGVINIYEAEAENVRWIFEKRAAGCSNWSIAKELFEKDDVYFKDSVKKNACKISSILYDKRYIGVDGYPRILDKKLFDRVQERKGKPWGNNKRQYTVGGRTEFIYTEKLKKTTYIPLKSVFEKEKALKTTLKSENADANQIKTAIFDLAFEKYNCIS